MTECVFQLSQQEPFTCFLLFAHLVFDDFLEIRNSLLVIAGMNVIVGVCVVPLLLRTPMNGIPTHVADNIFCIVNPILFDVAFSQPSTSSSINGWLGLIEPAHISECRGSFIECSLVKLRTSHEQPSLPKQGVVFLSVQPFNVFFGLSASLRPLWAFLDAV